MASKPKGAINLDLRQALVVYDKIIDLCVYDKIENNPDLFTYKFDFCYAMHCLVQQFT